MILPGHHTTVVHFNDAAKVADRIVAFLEGEKIPLGIGLIGLMMVIAHQSCPDPEPEPEKVGKMVQDLSEYVGAYWGGGD